MNMTRRFFILMTIGAVLIPASVSLAAEAEKPDPKNDARKAELQKRFKERYPNIRAAKKAGTIGETADGYLDFVAAASDKELQKLVEEENADRRELYTLIAKETNATVETVAQRAAKRNFEKAEKGEYLKGTDGKWKKKGEA